MNLHGAKLLMMKIIKPNLETVIKVFCIFRNLWELDADTKLGTAQTLDVINCSERIEITCFEGGCFIHLESSAPNCSIGTANCQKQGNCYKA